MSGRAFCRRNELVHMRGLNRQLASVPKRGASRALTYAPLRPCLGPLMPLMPLVVRRARARGPGAA